MSAGTGWFCMNFEYFYSDRVIHGVKTALACLLAFVLIKSVHFYVDQWLLITIIVVMCAQISVGGMLQKSYMRFLGTFCGSVIAILTLKLFNVNEVVFAVVIAVSTFFFSYIATAEKSYSEAGTLGAVTVVIILLTPPPTIANALARFLEISLGILIAALISQFILPIHARQHLREIQAVTLAQIQVFYQQVFCQVSTENTAIDSQTLDEKIAQSLLKQRKLAVDSARELLGERFHLEHFQALLQAEKETLRAIAAMRYAYQTYPDLFHTLALQESLHQPIVEVLEKLSQSFETHEVDLTTIHIPDFQQIKANVLSLAKNFSVDEKITVYAFLFSTERLIQQLKNILNLA